LLAAGLSPLAAQAATLQALPLRSLYPVGGGYDTALQGFAREVFKHAKGPAVRLVMVPAAFADDPMLPEDPGILADDVQALQAACDAVVDHIRFPQGCRVGSVPLFVAADTSSVQVLRGLSDPQLDGVFFTGGDQGYAMRILANTPAEAAMSLAAQRGVVFGGSSAGAAMESLAMNAGYTDAGDSTTGLLKGSIDIWMGLPAQSQRGLEFGSRQVIIDEHVYSRGRLGRMMNASAQTADALGRGGLLGLGFDYDTGGTISGDRWLGAVSGASSGVIVDFRSADTRYRWVGPHAALSARHVLTHLMPPSAAVSMDLVSRVPYLAGRALAWEGEAPQPPSPQLRAGDRATLILSGDVADDLGGPVLREFVRQAAVQPLGKLLIVAAGYAAPAAAQADLDVYARALVKAGWRGQTRSYVHGQTLLDPTQAREATAVLFLGGSQALLRDALADAKFRQFVDTAARNANVLMMERAMTAAAGESFDAIDEDASSDGAIAGFMAGTAVVKPGLGLVQGAAFEPRLQTDMRWGRLYGLAAKKRHLAVLGISEASAVVVDRWRASVLGQNPVLLLDARRATFMTGDNGALGAFNVLVDVYTAGEHIGH
jgi:cyanophycinase-like exopeptidase